MEDNMPESQYRATIQKAWKFVWGAKIMPRHKVLWWRASIKLIPQSSCVDPLIIMCYLRPATRNDDAASIWECETAKFIWWRAPWGLRAGRGGFNSRMDWCLTLMDSNLALLRSTSAKRIFSTKKVPGVRVSEHGCWLAPPRGFLKINVDAAVKASSQLLLPWQSRDNNALIHSLQNSPQHYLQICSWLKRKLSLSYSRLKEAIPWKARLEI
ncbi:hypothetical protein TorRG33x02_329760 [Trema orientale]|uniref:Reverse transcriptase zinc-binding domain-containing protein n=1 Tax=Trema orientale TaxID=63057 RepID=A0A2P5B8B3_TREOI|nr:hypothetical protein TorRG33x02_329760 [Trema orientale]